MSDDLSYTHQQCLYSFGEFSFAPILQVEDNFTANITSVTLVLPASSYRDECVHQLSQCRHQQSCPVLRQSL